jgi:phosphoribosylglycinamide formyltransferase-1
MLISGGGTTMAQIIIACQEGVLRGLVGPALVIASRPDAGGMEKALKKSMRQEDILCIRRGNYNSEEEWGEAIIKECKARDVNFVGQYGWLPLTPSNVIRAFPGRMVNQHPGPLDPGRADFGGKWMMGRAVHAARLLFVRETKRDYWTEATVQRVAEEYDKGAVLGRMRVGIFPDDDVVSLQERVLPSEHKLQIETLREFALGIEREVTQRDPLVRPGEEEILQKAKLAAHYLFPRG